MILTRWRQHDGGFHLVVVPATIVAPVDSTTSATISAALVCDSTTNIHLAYHQQSQCISRIEKIQSTCDWLESNKDEATTTQLLSLNHILFLSITTSELYKTMLSYFKTKTPRTSLVIDGFTKNEQDPSGFKESPSQSIELIKDEVLKTIAEVRTIKQ
ncbi:hypothetical protein A0J61_06984 [Choanephora cucurbitarum]|uniref:Uncharacterized protein n=1 Tax=Choanephora cucurbitarum TaxID=101091 RepID=A0A1C7N8K0_9FUNG|nr:hypothetical protein A0J61_06984 [Choanephora cucurbitarum]